VKLYIEYKDETEQNFESDYYSCVPAKNQEPALGPYAKKHKIEGLYFSMDHKDKRTLLPIGLTGIKKAIKIINKTLKEVYGDKTLSIKYFKLDIGVTWTIFNDHNCSDYITVDLLKGTIDFSNQDWYVQGEEYPEHIAQLNDFLDKNFGLTNKILPYYES